MKNKKKLYNILYVISYGVVYIIITEILNLILHYYKIEETYGRVVEGVIYITICLIFLFILYSTLYRKIKINRELKIFTYVTYSNTTFDIKKESFNFYVDIKIEHNVYFVDNKAINNGIVFKNFRISYLKLLKIIKFKSPERFMKSDLNCLKILLSLGMDKEYNEIVSYDNKLKNEIRKNKIKNIF